MNSTDERLRAFYTKHLVTAAVALEARQIRFFPLGADDDDDWYESPPDTPVFVELDGDAFEEQLRAHWESQGFGELAELCGPLCELAKDLEVEGEEREDVSPFVYVMF